MNTKSRALSVQMLGWGPNSHYQTLRHYNVSVASWYQTEPHASSPKLSSRATLKTDRASGAAL